MDVMGNQVIHLVVGEITLFLSCINEFRDVVKSQAESLSAPSCSVSQLLSPPLRCGLVFWLVWLEDGSFVQLSPRFEIYFFIVGVHDLTSGGSQGGGQLTEMISHNWLTSKIRSRRGGSFPRQHPSGKKNRVAVLVGAFCAKGLFKRFFRKA